MALTANHYLCCHSREGGNLCRSVLHTYREIPACAGMTALGV